MSVISRGEAGAPNFDRLEDGEVDELEASFEELCDFGVCAGVDD